MDGDEKSAAIVKTILLLGKNLGIEVVAEGIETRYQLEILRSLGCRLGQGYIFSEPVEATLAGLMLHRSFSFSANPLIDLALPEAILQMQEVQ
jgi:EAL domain-containing protein (putative c-di-GMP-specific phosphodiesterase class I)